MTESYREVVARLASAQKGTARSAPAYSRFVNRRLGRLLAAWAYRAGLSPNAVTGISGLCTFAAIGLLALVAPGWWLGVVVALLLVLGYAFDSADGQVARLTGRGSAAGEWLDHAVDAAKTAALPLALLVGLFRAEAAPTPWLVVPLVHAVVGSTLFFMMILTEQVRRAHGVETHAGGSGDRASVVRALLVAPMDYGLLCVSFVLLGSGDVFLALYTLIVAGTTGFAILAARRWFKEISQLGVAA